MTRPICPVIPRMAPRREWADRRAPGIADVELFLPADPANAGMIGVYVYVGQHTEASIDYYRNSKPPRTDAEREACRRAVASYAAHIASIPAEDRVTLQVVKRRTPAMRRAAWHPPGSAENLARS